MSWCDCPPAKCLGERADQCRHRAMLAAGWIDPLSAVAIRDDIKALGVLALKRHMARQRYAQADYEYASDPSRYDQRETAKREAQRCDDALNTAIRSLTADELGLVKI